MNIIQARELAMSGKTVRSPGGINYVGDAFLEIKNWSNEAIFGEWHEKREPRRVYAVERISDGQLLTCQLFDLKEFKFDVGERSVEFVEVVP